MNTPFLAFLGATAFFVPASAVPGPSAAAPTIVQSGQSRFGGGASRTELIELRRDFGRAIENVRFNLDRRLVALDLSDPVRVTQFQDGQKVLAAWDAMATVLPQLSDEQLQVVVAPLGELGRLSDLQQRGTAKATGTAGAVVRACNRSGADHVEYAGGQSPTLIIQPLLDLITNSNGSTGRLWSSLEVMFVTQAGGFPPGVASAFTYASGLDGEKQISDFQCLFEYYSAIMPEITLPETAPGIPGRQITVPHPLKVIFDLGGLVNGRELARARFMNADYAACEQANLTSMVSELASAIDGLDLTSVNTKLDNVINKVDTRASATDLANLSVKVDTRASAIDLTNFRTDLTARVDSRASSIDLANFRTDITARVDSRASALQAIDLMTKLIIIEDLILDLHDHDDDHDHHDHDDLTAAPSSGGGKAR